MSALMVRVQLMMFILESVTVAFVPLLTLEHGTFSAYFAYSACFVFFGVMSVIYIVRLPYYRLAANIMVSINV